MQCSTLGQDFLTRLKIGRVNAFKLTAASGDVQQLEVGGWCMQVPQVVSSSHHWHFSVRWTFASGPHREREEGRSSGRSTPGNARMATAAEEVEPCKPSQPGQAPAQRETVTVHSSCKPRAMGSQTPPPARQIRFAKLSHLFCPYCRTIPF